MLQQGHENENETIIDLENSCDEPQLSHQRMHSVSISMPCTPLGHTKKVVFDEHEQVLGNGIPNSGNAPQSKKTRFYSQPMPKGVVHDQDVKNQSIKKFRDKRFDSFKTMSGKIERQLTFLRGKPREEEESSTEKSTEIKVQKDALPVDRYFDALEGPELENLRVILIPQYIFNVNIDFLLEKNEICVSVFSGI